jgi:hypothetical protein
MHDPQTVICDLRIFGCLIFTFWHVDPETDGSDDSCGWFAPRPAKAERDRIWKLGQQEFSTLFRRREQEALGDPHGYAYVCYEPETTYDAIRYAWLRIKWKERKKRHIGAWENAYLWSLAANPVDNLMVTVAGVKNEHDCAAFFMTVYRAYRRFNRPWWRHPRFHAHHWQIQFHPWQQLRRRLFDRCAHCGKPFIKESPVSIHQHGPKPPWWKSRKGYYHMRCYGAAYGNINQG